MEPPTSQKYAKDAQKPENPSLNEDGNKEQAKKQPRAAFPILGGGKPKKVRTQVPTQPTIQIDTREEDIRTRPSNDAVLSQKSLTNVSGAADSHQSNMTHVSTQKRVTTQEMTKQEAERCH